MTKHAIKAIVFDAFGTLCYISNRKSPYRSIAAPLGDRDKTSRLAMTRPLGLAGFYELINPGVSLREIIALERDLHEELLSIVAYPEVGQVLQQLKMMGYKLAIASNLAQPYAVPVKCLLPFELDAYGWSFDVGFMKPDKGIYTWVGERLGCTPEQMLHVGDTYAADFAGATEAGLQALHLSRNKAIHGKDVISDLTGVPAWLRDEL